MKFVFNPSSQTLVEDKYAQQDFVQNIGTDKFVEMGKLAKKVSIPVAGAITLFKCMIPKPVLAAAVVVASEIPKVAAGTSGLGDRLLPLLNMVQDLSLPVGIVVASWGLIDIIVGNPQGKDKIKNAIIGYVGMFLIPEVFYGIHAAFSK